MFRPKFLKRAVCVFISAVMLFLNFPITARAEEEEVVTSGTLGDIAWTYKEDLSQGNKNILTISGNGDIPSLEELGMEQYPWEHLEVNQVIFSEGISSIPSHFSGSPIVILKLPISMKRIKSGAFYGDIRFILISTYNLDCVYEDEAFNLQEELTFCDIFAYVPSTTEAFAKENGLNFISHNSPDNEHDEKNLGYRLYNDHAVVADYIGNASLIEIPSEYEGLPVTAVDSKAFEGNVYIEKVIMPDSVTTIENNAFNSCSNLREIIIPDGFTTIGDYAFNDCSNLREIVIPDGLTTVGDYAFNGCSNLREIVIPDSITTIGDYAFGDCIYLSSVKLPVHIKQLDYKVFYNTPSLIEIDGAADLDVILSSETYIYPPDDVTAYVPEFVTIMYMNAYQGYENVIIGKNLKELRAIGFDSIYSYDYAAQNIIVEEENPYFCSENGIIYNKDKTEVLFVSPCHECENGVITIPFTVKKISYPLYNCTVERYEVENGNTEFVSDDGVLYDFDRKTLIAYPSQKKDKTYVIPSRTERISSGSFYKNIELDFLRIPQSVKKIEKGALWRTSLKFILFDNDGTTELDISYDFHRTNQFNDPNVPYYAYENSIIKDQFPDHFITLLEESERICGEGLTWKFEDFDLTISGTGEMTEFSKGKYPWNALPVVNIKFNGENIKIADNAFYDAKYLKSLDLTGVTEIGVCSFFSCKNLSSIIGDESVKMVKSQAFYGTEWISKHAADEATILGSVLVNYNINSEKDIIPDNITYVADSAFYGCKCKTLYVPEKGVLYSESAFAHNNSIEHLRIIDSDKDITIDDIKKAASLCEEVSLTDENGNTVTGLGYRHDNTIMYLVNALRGTPFWDNIIDDYCENIIQSNNCTSDMTDIQLITVLCNYIKNNVKYGFTYAEDSYGTLYDANNTKWSLSSGMTHFPAGIITYGRGVCSSYAYVVNSFVKKVQNDGISNTLKSMSIYGKDHEWNVIGLDVGTKNEIWYYLDLTNAEFLVGYDNSLITNNPEMYSYDPNIVKNNDGTYTIKVNDTNINLQGNDPLIHYLKGDVTGDGDISIDDATLALTIYARNTACLSTEGYTDVQKKAADIDGDGEITISDVTAILSYYAMCAAGMTPEWI